MLPASSNHATRAGWPSWWCLLDIQELCPVILRLPAGSDDIGQLHLQRRIGKRLSPMSCIVRISTTTGPCCGQDASCMAACHGSNQDLCEEVTISRCSVTMSCFVRALCWGQRFLGGDKASFGWQEAHLLSTNRKVSPSCCGHNGGPAHGVRLLKTKISMEIYGGLTC